MKGCSEFVVVDGFLFQIWQLVQRQILMRAEEGSIVTTNAENPSKTSVSAMNNSPYWSVSCSTEMR